MTEDLDMKICAYYDQVEGLLKRAKDCFNTFYKKLSEFERVQFKQLMKEASE